MRNLGGFLVFRAVEARFFDLNRESLRSSFHYLVVHRFLCIFLGGGIIALDVNRES